MIFQSTLLQEERHQTGNPATVNQRFQSTLLQEERHNTDDACTDGLHISIHAPTRGATGLKIPASHVYKFQSTLLQEERPDYKVVLMDCLGFQSTLLQEERRKRKTTFCSPQLFQSTLLQEERLSTMLFKASIRSISIHAPTRGATLDICMPLKLRLFQSTLLQEERPVPPWGCFHSRWNFNPRSYKRSDSKNAQYSLCISAIIIA